MEVFKRSRPVDKAKIEDIVQKLASGVLKGLDSIVLYGSYVSGDFVPGRSDINILIILESEEDIDLDHINKLYMDVIGKHPIVPLVLSKEYIRRSLDIYPLEYLTISNGCRVLYGSDFILHLEIKKIYLRLQLERELKSKLLLLRQIYFTKSKDAKFLAQTLLRSWKAIGPMLIGIYFLLFSKYSKDFSQIIGEISKHLAISMDSIYEVYHLKKANKFASKKDAKRLYKSYVMEIMGLSQKIDTWEDVDGQRQD